MAVFMRSGRSSLDLVWTVRFRSVWPTETLTDPASLSMWLRGTYPHVDVKPELCTTEFLAEIKDLRENVYSLVRAAIAQEPLHTDGRSALNHLADGPRFRHQVTSERVAQVSASDHTQFLAELAIDAISVLSAEPARLKMCEGPDCALPFLDESRGGSRRWCTAQRCGNRVNTKAYRRRAKS